MARPRVGSDSSPAREESRFAVLRGGRSAEPLLRSAYSLLINTVLTSGLGMAFWIVAARLYAPAAVGRDSALVAAMMQISSVAQLNMANTLVRFIGTRPDALRVLVLAYAVSAAAALLLGAGFVVLAPQLADDFRFLTNDPTTGAVFVLAVVLWGVFALQDAALTATRRAAWVPIENGTFGVLKLLALPILLAVGSSHGVFLAWVIPMCALLLPVNWLLFRRVLAAHGVQTKPPALDRHRIVTFLAQDYVATVLAQASLTLLPIVVVATLGSSANAYFYVPFTIAIAFDALFWSVCTSLVAEGALDESRIPHLARLLVRRFALILLPGVGLLVALAPLVMLPFGEDYVRESTSLLRLLVCGSVFRAVVVLAAAIWRLERRGSRIVAMDASLLALLLCGAVPLANAMGLAGVALAWVGSSVVVGTAAMPHVARVLRSARGGGADPRPERQPEG